MRKSLITLIGALLLSTTVFGAMDAHAQAGIGSSESGTWVIGPRAGNLQSVVRPSGRVDTLIYQDGSWGRHGGYGEAGPVDWYNHYDYQIRGGYHAGYQLGRGLRALFGADNPPPSRPVNANYGWSSQELFGD